MKELYGNNPSLEENERIILSATETSEFTLVVLTTNYKVKEVEAYTNTN